MTSTRWFLLMSGLCEPAFNMALDEALLKSMPRLGNPVLRFYGWTEPAASFGYFQKHTDIERVTSLRPLVRRPTGGGLVPHDSDWTYSLAFPSGDGWYSLSAVESYRKVHEWIHAAFAQLGVETNLAPDCVKTQPGQCFQGHERFDLLWRGKKIAGAAQRRTRDGLLIQGSVQPAALATTCGAWHQAMCEVAVSRFKARWEELSPDHALKQLAANLAREKYSRANYNENR